MNQYDRPQYRGTSETEKYSADRIARALIDVALEAGDGCAIDGRDRTDCDDQLCDQTCAVVELAQLALRIDTDRLTAEAVNVELRHHSLTNEVTGLRNKRAFGEDAVYFDANNQRLVEDGHSPEPSSLFFIDLDRFKPVNDTYGHDVGDQVIQAVASSLKSNHRGGDLLYHLSGDEFALACPTVFTVESAESYVQRLQVAVESATVEVGDAVVGVGATIGYGFTSADYGMVAALEAADHMMNARKDRRSR